ncbi:ABC transporter ATP-binding protein [Pseudarthrobacter sp. So.54]
MEVAEVAIKDVLDVSGLVRRYGDLTAVDGVSFHIRTGETYGLLGPNGAGKTTIISMVAGLIPANEGTVRVAGRSMTPSETEAKRAIGLVPQELAIYPDLTARENLKFFGRLQGLNGKQLTQRTNEVLELIGLGDRAGDLTKKYSGGMKRQAEHRHRPAPPAHPADPGRTDGRGGSAVPQRHPRIRGAALRRRHGGALHHPLHGGSRAALRPDCHY